MKSNTDRNWESVLFAGVGASGSTIAMRYGFPTIWVLLERMANEGMLTVSVSICEQTLISMYKMETNGSWSDLYQQSRGSASYSCQCRQPR